MRFLDSLRSLEMDIFWFVNSLYFILKKIKLVAFFEKNLYQKIWGIIIWKTKI